MDTHRCWFRVACGLKPAASYTEAPMLRRYRLLDLSRRLPGPFASHVLADMGMDVVRIEQPGPRRDQNRRDRPSPDGSAEAVVRATAFHAIARNKRSIALNLLDPQTRPAAREVFFRLVRDADVVLEAYRPGVTAELGIDYEAVRRQ